MASLLIGFFFNAVGRLPALSTSTRSSTSCVREAARDLAAIVNRALDRPAPSRGSRRG